MTSRRRSLPDRPFTPLGESDHDSSTETEEANEDTVKSTFIMVGLSQHGKTATIDALLQGQGLEGVPHDAIGNGNVRCTDHSHLYPLHQPFLPTRLRRSKPWKSKASTSSSSATKFEKTPSPRRRSEGVADEPLEPAKTYASSEDAAESRRMWHLWKCDQNYKAQVRTSKPVRAHCDGPHLGKNIQFQVLDTPGLEDSHGGDINNMANVIETLTSGRITHISGMVMVMKCGAPFSPAWRRQVEWYWKQFPQLHSQWIFVHTNADPIGFNAKERNVKNTCFERECMDRKQQMLEIMREITGTDMDCLMHIFVENFIPSNEFGFWEPGQEALRHYQTSQHNRLYNLLAHFPIITLGTMPLVKGPDMLALDELMRAHLDSAQQSMIRTLKEVEMELSEYMSLLKDHMQQKLDTENNIDHRVRELKEKDSDHLQLLKSKDLHVDYDFWEHAFRRPRAEGTLQFRHKLRSRKIVNDPTYAKAFVELDDVSDCSWHVRVCGSMFRSIQCDMLAYTYKKDFHAEEIKVLKVELEIFRKLVDKQDQYLTKLQETERHKRNQVVESEARLMYCQELLGHLTRDMSLEEYCNVAPFYKNASEARWPAPKCCAELAMMLQVHSPSDQSLGVSPRSKKVLAPGTPQPPPPLGIFCKNESVPGQQAVREDGKKMMETSEQCQFM